MPPVGRPNVYVAPAGTTTIRWGNGAPTPPPPPPPPAPSITISSDGAAVVGAAEPITVAVANITGPVDVTVARVSGPAATISPVPTNHAPGELTKLAYATAAAIGTLRLQASAPIGGTLVQSNTLDIAVTAAPSPPPSPPPPAPAPMPSGQAVGASVVDMVSVTPVAASVGASLWTGSKPWTCGLLFRRGAAPAGRTVGAHDGSVQVDWLTTWDDGSLRFARASGVTAAAEIPILTRGTAASGANVAEPSIAASVAFTSVVDHLGAAVAGGSFTADLAVARAAGAGTWGRTQARKVRELLGTVCSEFHYFVPTADDHLAVWFYVRAYSSGDVEVETVIENGWLLVAAPGQRTYSVDVSVGGSSRYTGSAIVHRHHTRWSRTDWVGADPGSAMVQAPASLRASGVIPTFGVESLDAAAYTAWPEQGTKHSAWTRDLADRPAPFSIANLDPAMGSGGHTDSYGIVPEWMATWLIEGHHGAYWSIVGNARAHGRYHLHYRDEVDGRVVRPTNRSAIGLNDTNLGISDNGGSGTLTPVPSGAVGPSWTYTHSPASAFCGALLTARWSLIEEVQFQSATGVMTDTFSIRSGRRTLGWWGQMRSIGWRTRDMAQAEVLTPSILGGSVLSSGPEFEQRADLLGRIEALLDLWHDQYVSGSGTGVQFSARGNALGAGYQNADFDLYGSTLDGVHGYGGLQNGFYLTGAFYLFNCRPTIAGGAQSQAAAVMEHLAKYPIGLLGAAPGATRDWRVFAHVTIPVGTPGFNGSTTPATTYYTSWDEQYAQQQVVRDWAAGTWPLTAGSDTFIRKIQYNNNEAAPALVLSTRTAFTADTDLLALTWATMQMHEAAGRINAPGADLAVQRLLTSGTWAGSVGAIFRTRPGFSCKTPRDLPSWVPATVGQAAQVPMTNTIDSVFTQTAAMGGSANANEILDFSGGPFNRYYGRWGGHMIHGGGHSATQYNGVIVADLNTLQFVEVGAPTILPTYNDYENRIRLGVPPESFADATSNPREVDTGVPGSAHTYDSMVILPPPLAGDARGALLRGVSTAVGASVSRETGWSHAFRAAAATWSRYSVNHMAGNFSAGAACVFDPTRGRVWPLIPGNAGNAYLNAISRQWINEGSSVGLSSYADLVHGAYHEHADLIVAAAQGSDSSTSGPIRLVYQQAGVTVPARATATLSAPLATNGSYANASLLYVPDLRRLVWYCWNSPTPNAYQEIEVPANPTDPWIVTTRPVTGLLLSDFFAGDPPASWTYKRLDYSPQLKSLVWVAARSQDKFSAGGRVVVIRIVQ